MPIYRVIVSKVVYAVADQRGELTMLSNAQRTARCAIDDSGDWDVDAVRVDSLASIPTDWRDAIPYGEQGCDDRTIEQLFAAEDR